MSIQGAMNQLLGSAGGIVRDLKILDSLDVEKQEQLRKDAKIQGLKNQEEMLDELHEGQEEVKTGTADMIQTIKDLRDVDTYGDVDKSLRIGQNIRKIASEQQERAETIKAQKDIAKQLYAETGDAEYLDKYKKLVQRSTNADYASQTWSRDAKSIDKQIQAGINAYNDLVDRYQQANDITDSVLARKNFLEARDADPAFDAYIRGAFKDNAKYFLERGSR